MFLCMDPMPRGDRLKTSCITFMFIRKSGEECWGYLCPMVGGGDSSGATSPRPLYKDTTVLCPS